MTRKQIFIVLIASIFALNTADAQNTLFASDSVGLSRAVRNSKFSFLKWSAVGNDGEHFSMQYERSISRSTSVAVSLKWSPGNSLPIKNLIISTAGQNDPNLVRTIENLRIKYSSISPELRLYTSKKGYGRGFYIAPFYRYACFKTDGITVHFGDQNNYGDNIRLSGKLATNTVGIKLGAQWLAGKKISLDWWFLGPHYGTGLGVFSGVASKPLSETQQENIKTELHNLDIPLTKKVINVTERGGSITLNELWAGVRGGVSIGW